MSLKSILKVANYYSVKYGFDKIKKEARTFENKYKTASSVEIAKVAWDAEYDVASEYYLYGKIIGSFKGQNFSIMISKYVVGAYKFESIDELRSDLIGGAEIVEIAPEELALSRENLQEIIMMISDEDLGKGLEQANAVAELASKFSYDDDF